MKHKLELVVEYDGRHPHDEFDQVKVYWQWRQGRFAGNGVANGLITAICEAEDQLAAWLDAGNSDE